MARNIIALCDNEYMKKMLVNFFEKNSFTVTFAEDPIEIIDMTNTLTPEALIVDTAPGNDFGPKDSLDFLLSIDDTSHTPIIFLKDDFSPSEVEQFNGRVKFFHRNLSTIKDLLIYIENY